ncbi:hypothetical protein [Methanolapillus ohkumae]|uniref:Uncharacterized protein n=1 Tax=Methanolapillus ohkumae TaxID=3028298 RepID=A0AA96V8K4_9EURY|nr:hypothetical protein MsAm2_10650 [Methanosarcinaceae archaeon Am2]
MKKTGDGHNCSCGGKHERKHEHEHEYERKHEHEYEHSGNHFSQEDACVCLHADSPADAESKATVSEMMILLDEFEKSTSGMIYGNFIKNESLQLYLVSILEKVQNKALSLDPDFISRHPKTDFSFLQTIQDQAVHPVLGLNAETLWDMIRLDVPFLNRSLNVIVNGCSHNH